jgi:hypothetical protein
LRRRERASPNVNAPTLIGTTQMWYNGAPFSDPLPSETNHYVSRGPFSQQDLCLDETHPGPPYHSGGPLYVFHWRDGGVDVLSYGTYWGPYFGTLGFVYTGGFIPSWKWQDFAGAYSCTSFAQEFTSPGSVYPSASNAKQYGATGWKRFSPGNPTADLGVFIGEGLDTAKMLKGAAMFFRNAWKSIGGSLKKPSKALSGQWLSIQFGWLPFVNDLRKFYQTTRKLDATIQRIKQQNGQWQRRGGSVVDDTQSVLISSNDHVTGHWPALHSAFYVDPNSSGNYTASMSTTTRVWFEGRFRYWIPNIDSPWWEARAVAELYGAMPNPALIWELIPFSWLVDWMSNVGDVFANMDAGYADNLAASYAYVMKSVEVMGEFESTHTLKAATLHDLWKFPLSWKSREGASRFGFSTTEAEFSARQWSILAALGLQRKR